MRLEIARQLIVTTSMSIGRIALATGFSSGPYLTHAFRRQFRVTPSALRVGLKAEAKSAPRRRIKTRSFDGGRCLIGSWASVSEALAIAEGEQHR